MKSDLNESKFIKSLMEKSIRPNIDALVRILMRGDIAVLLHEPDRCWAPALPILGWDGKAKVFAINRTRAMRTIGKSDHVTAAWAARKVDANAGGRIFVIAHAGSLLVNFSRKDGYSIEPGSTDAEWAKVADAAVYINAPHGGDG